jgi:predicted phosphodiesterase
MRFSLLILAALGATAIAAAQIPDTERPFHNGPGVFRFAILADRTAAPRPGVFEDAVDKVVRLQPEFVLSVGDLIGGYTRDPVRAHAEWDAMETIIAQLPMKFFYVAGNHDISNPEMLAVWKERRGDPWYSFVHEQVLFLVLHTEEIHRGGIGPEQAEFVRRTLAEHADVRWTLVFMHRPLWFHAERQGYEAVEAALAGRRYTVFSGHHHKYLKGERQGMAHYILATCGGKSGLRGPEHGEFDHVTWVTMTDDGPVVVNIALSGIVPDDIVVERVESPPGG